MKNRNRTTVSGCSSTGCGPGGMRKEDFRYDLWAKQIAPSAALRRWYHEDMPGALGRVRPPLRRGIAAVASRGGIRPSDHRKRHRYVGVRLPERFAESCPDPARLSGKSYECYDCIVVIQVVYLRVNCCRDSIIGVYPFVKYQYGITVFFNAYSYFVQ